MTGFFMIATSVIKELIYQREIEDSSTFTVKFSCSYFVQAHHKLIASTLGALNNAHEPSQDHVDETLQQNTERNIAIVVEDTISIKGKKKKTLNGDQTLNFFLRNVESTMSTKDLKLLDVTPTNKLRNSFPAKDSAKDQILVVFLRSFEFLELGHETKK